MHRRVLFLALWMRFEFRLGAIPQMYLNEYLKIIGPWIVICLVVFQLFRLYNSIWSFVSIDELFRIILADGVLLAAGLAYVLILKIDMPPLLLLCGLYHELHVHHGAAVLLPIHAPVDGGDQHGEERAGPHSDDRRRRGRTPADPGDQFNPRLGSRVVCIIDDNPSKRRRYLDGVEIAGGRQEIPDAVKKYQVNKIIFAIPTCDGQDRKGDSGHLQQDRLPGAGGAGDVPAGQRRGQCQQAPGRGAAGFLLGRDPIQVNLEEICRYISGKVVMVTGGGGSIGSELCRQIAKSNPEQLIIFDIYENNAYDIQMELCRTHPELNLEVLIGSVRDMGRLDDVMAKYRPELVFHAAAHKHVPLMEDSPNEAIKNNVFGTYKMAMASVKYGVKKFVLISTDKAVNPTNIMGASKRLCEMVVQMMNRRSPNNTDFVAVRFGNVLGSNGSVIPLFKKQIAEGGPVTVTHPEITRFL